MKNEQVTPPKAVDLESRIQAFIESELLAGQLAIQPDDDLLSGEVLDSVAVLRLATFVQEEFDLNMAPSDFVIENFQTVAVLAGYIRRSLEAESSAADS